MPKGDDVTTIHNGDCIEVLSQMPPESVDAIVTDPPYGLSNTTPAQVADTITKWAGGDRDHVPTGRGFMGKSWDAFVPPPAVWDECLRVLKPGGHMVVFAGSRTQDLMGLSIRLAGFEMRDSLAWLYGSGFPKSMDVSKAIDKEANRRDLFEPIRAHIREWRDRNGMTNADLNAAVGSKTNGCGMARHWTSTEGGQHAIPSKEQWANLKGVLGWPDCELDELYASVKDGAERPVTGRHRHGVGVGAAGLTASGEGKARRDWAATPEAAQWDGWGTALKPAFEPVVLARKPLAEKTVARNVLEHGTGALNIDACRIETPDGLPPYTYPNGPGGNTFTVGGAPDGTRSAPVSGSPSGRWPANVLLDQHAAAWVDEQSGKLHTQDPATRASKSKRAGVTRMGTGRSIEYDDRDGTSGASRFFYTAKAPKRERPTYTRPMLRLRDNLTPEQADHVRARLQEAGISLD